ncbi:glycoside hydrolase family protein [Neobacillus dielmonensis]|uniref:family 43 glycosylhydrolase n=1 Tax=Neobacillus dielmonensis TaxID=1347369 RepID=UPI0005A913CF|nr:family 43 glycosylhydrolase [Neobacillus dielmonensis]
MLRKGWLLYLVLLLALMSACTDLKQQPQSKSQKQGKIVYSIDELSDSNNAARYKKQWDTETTPTLSDRRQDVEERNGSSNLNLSFNKIMIKGNRKQVEQKTNLDVKVDKNLVEPISQGTEWVESFPAGDSKLLEYNGSVLAFITSGQMLLKRGKQPLKKMTPAIPANWFDMVKVSQNKTIMITGSFEKNSIEIHEVDLKNGTAKKLSVIETEGNLKIDPTIVHTKDGYYATFTDIQGTINRGNPSQENGRYTIKLYHSQDLKKWEYVQSILTEDKNLEDGQLVVDENDQFHFLYEEEEIDRGHSRIKVISSGDKGKSWGQAKIILSDMADHEPSSLMKVNPDRFIFFYSSDLDHGGTGSYEFANMKYAILDQQFTVLKKDINLDAESGASLYDVLKVDNKLYFIYAKYSNNEEQLALWKIDKKLNDFLE